MWKLSPFGDRDDAANLATRLGIDPVIALRVRANRITERDTAAFLNPDRSHIRRLQETLPGLPVATWKTIWQTELCQQRVAVFSDYDVDGSSSAEIVKRALAAQGTETLFGSARVEEGFGLSERFVQEAVAWGAQWLVTVDCGSTQSEHVAAAQAAGMRVVVIDHHEIDIDNPADMHCNPGYARARGTAELKRWLDQASDLMPAIERAQATKRAGGNVDLQPLITASKTLLEAARPYGITAPKIQAAMGEARTLLYEYAEADTLTGSALSWMWARELWDIEPDWWWQEPLYLAGLGLLADMASMLVIENRAMCRLAAEHPPTGIRTLAEMLDEDPTRPAGLIRSRAALNLAKRTTRVRGDDVAAVYADDAFKTAWLAAEYVQASTRKDAMLERARELLAEREAELDEAELGWAVAILEDWPNDAGQSGVIANKLAGDTGRPAVVFARRPDGSYKFSARNGKRNPQKIGPLMYDPATCEAAQYERNGVLERSLGGHADVVSGACAPDRVTAVIDAFNAWLPALKTARVYSSIIVDERQIAPERAHRIFAESALLEPLSNDSWGVQVSMHARLLEIDTYSMTGTIQLTDDSVFPCVLTDRALEAGNGWQEWKIRVSPGAWWLREWEPVEAPDEVVTEPTPAPTDRV
jgi:single-stranded DNA-specific DHH superfamily exonuclease